LKTTAGAKFCEWKIPETESADIMEVNRNGVLRSSSIHPLCFTSRLFLLPNGWLDAADQQDPNCEEAQP
jgi:hypothetical protein